MTDTPLFDIMTAPVDIPEPAEVEEDIDIDALPETPENMRIAQFDPEDDADGNNTLNGGM